jgi:hypothetical protein
MIVIPTVLSFILGFVWGWHIKFKVRKTYIFSGLVLALFLGSYMYYNQMISIVYVSAIFGIAFGSYFGGKGG